MPTGSVSAGRTVPTVGKLVDFGSLRYWWELRPVTPFMHLHKQGESLKLEVPQE